MLRQSFLIPNRINKLKDYRMYLQSIGIETSQAQIPRTFPHSLREVDLPPTHLTVGKCMHFTLLFLYHVSSRLETLLYPLMPLCKTLLFFHRFDASSLILSSANSSFFFLWSQLFSRHALLRLSPLR